MSNKLVVGTDYGDIFGLKLPDQFIYNGGISWTAISKGQKVTRDSQKQTDAVIKYLQQGTNYGNFPS